jgi:hypothetical protein
VSFDEDAGVAVDGGGDVGVASVTEEGAVLVVGLMAAMSPGVRV